jgi:hypothetical protein
LLHGVGSTPWLGQQLQPALRKLAEKLSSGDIVLTDDLLTPCWSHYGISPAVPLSGLWEPDSADHEPFAEAVTAWLNAGRQVVVLLGNAERFGRDWRRWQRIAQLYGTEPVMTLDNIAEAIRLAPWHYRRIEAEVPRKGIAAEGLVRIAADDLWRKDIPRRFIRLEVNEQTVAGPVPEGASYHYFAGEHSLGMARIALVSDAPLPPGFEAELMPVQSRLSHSFDPSVEIPRHHWISGTPVYTPPPEPKSVGYRIDVPAIWPPDRFAALLVLRGWPDREQPGLANVSVAGASAASAHVGENGWEGRVVLLPAVEPGAIVPVEWTWGTGDAGDRGVPWSRCEIQVIPQERNQERFAELGQAADWVHIGGGFSLAERYADRVPFRWTAGRSTLVLPEPDEGGEGTVTLVYHDGRPLEAESAEWTLWINGHRIEGRDSGPAVHAPFIVWEGRVPAAAWISGVNELTIVARPWSPADVIGSEDTRSLGIMVHRVGVTPDRLSRAVGP